MKGKLSNALYVLAVILIVLFICEYFIYFVVINQCSWPKLDSKLADKTITTNGNRNALKAMFIADTHLLGPYRGHWFDKLRRESQMYRAFQTSITLYDPEVVFILGDLFDEGQYCNKKQFNNYIERFSLLFEVPKGVKVFAVPGNHDLGFHYRLRYDLYEKFNTLFKTSPVQFKNIKGNNFVLINSMAMHGDGCYFCNEAQNEIQKVAEKLKCLKSGKSCAGITKLEKYSRPIVLQHFPMFRESDMICDERDSAPNYMKGEIFREKWECLSRNASEMIYDLLNPRLIFTGHTHHGCKVRHRDDIIEFTLPSFNWRNKNNPTFMLITSGHSATELGEEVLSAEESPSIGSLQTLQLLDEEWKRYIECHEESSGQEEHPKSDYAKEEQQNRIRKLHSTPHPPSDMSVATLYAKQIASGHRITQLAERILKTEEPLSTGTIQAQLQILDEGWNRYNERHEDLLGRKDFPESDYAKEDQHYATQEVYILARGPLLDLLQEPSPSAKPSPPPVQARLPKIVLPHFDGDPLQWEEFRDLFRTLVHENTTLSGAARLQYLKCALRGEPSNMLNNVSITDNNYNSAWQALVDRYDDKYTLITHHVLQILRMKSIERDTASNLKELQDTVSASRRALKNLGRPVEQQDEWFVTLTAQKLDKETRRDWETWRSERKQIPTFDELNEFLTTRIRAAEALPDSGPRMRSQTSDKVRSHTTQVNKDKQKSCPSCGKDHSLTQCPDFKKRSPQERIDFVKSSGMCLNCLGRHRDTACPSLGRCFVCSKSHHTLLHYSMLSTHAEGATADTPAVPILSTHARLESNQTFEPDTLLATAVVKVAAPNGRTTTVRALLDQGSEVSFVSEGLTRRLKLPREGTNATVFGMGATRCGTAKSLVQLQISPVVQGYTDVINAKALVLPRLTKHRGATHIPSRDRTHLQGLKLADPGGPSPRGVDLVLGADLYGDILVDGLLKGPPGTPVAQNTIFGWVLSGRTAELKAKPQTNSTTLRRSKKHRNSCRTNSASESSAPGPPHGGRDPGSQLVSQSSSTQSSWKPRRSASRRERQKSAPFGIQIRTLCVTVSKQTV